MKEVPAPATDTVSDPRNAHTLRVAILFGLLFFVALLTALPAIH